MMVLYTGWVSNPHGRKLLTRFRDELDVYGSQSKMM